MEDAAIRFALVDINEILKTLPHRYPMLLIERVINIRTDSSGTGIKNVTYTEPPFLGHFPERPVYPGVMMIEAMAQTAGVIGIKSVEGTEKPRAGYFLTIEKCKFQKAGDARRHRRISHDESRPAKHHVVVSRQGPGERRRRRPGRCRRDVDGLTGATMR